MADALDSVTALAADFRRYAQLSEGEDPVRAKRQATTAASLESVATELADARKRLRPISTDYGDLSDLPAEVMEQLQLTRVDELEEQLRDIVASADGKEIGLDPIIIELYRRHKVVQQRRFIMNKLYRMGQKGLIHSVEGKKGIYCLPKTPPANTSYGGLGDDLDDDIPF